LNIKSSEKKEKNEVEIVVEVSAEEFDSAINDAFRKNRNSISVPGFRKGKAPRKIIERMYGVSVFHSDALDIIMPKVLSFAIEESKLNLVGFPQVKDLDIKEGEGGLDVTLSVSEYPEVKLGEYKGISAVKHPADIPDSAIDSEIAGIRLRNARYEKTERPAVMGDIAVIDYEGFVDGEAFEGGKGEDYELELGSKSFIPGFEEKIQGMTVGKERDLDLVFPDEYAEHLAGKPVVFKVKLKELREKILPDLDDEFAKDVSEFDTLEEYKASIRENLAKARQETVDASFENALLEKVIETLEADIPDVMIEEQIDNSMNNYAEQLAAYGMDAATYLKMTNTTPETLRESMRASSEKQVKVMLALEKIAELEGVEVSEEDIENEYKEAAERYAMEIEKLKEAINQDAIIREVKFRRAAKIVTENGIAEDPPPDDEPEIQVETVNESGQQASEEPAANTQKQKKPAQKKTTSKKDAPVLDDAVGADAGLSDGDSAGDVDNSLENTDKPAAKKAVAKKPKPEDGNAGQDDALTADSAPVKKTASKAKTTKTE